MGGSWQDGIGMNTMRAGCHANNDNDPVHRTQMRLESGIVDAGAFATVRSPG